MHGLPTYAYVLIFVIFFLNILLTALCRAAGKKCKSPARPQPPVPAPKKSPGTDSTFLHGKQSDLITRSLREIKVEKINLNRIIGTDTRKWVEVYLDGEWVIPLDHIHIEKDMPMLSPKQRCRYKEIRVVSVDYTRQDDGMILQSHISPVG